MCVVPCFELYHTKVDPQKYLWCTSLYMWYNSRQVTTNMRVRIHIPYPLCTMYPHILPSSSHHYAPLFCLLFSTTMHHLPSHILLSTSHHYALLFCLLFPPLCIVYPHVIPSPLCTLVYLPFSPLQIFVFVHYLSLITTNSFLEGQAMSILGQQHPTHLPPPSAPTIYLLSLRTLCPHPHPWLPPISLNYEHSAHTPSIGPRYLSTNTATPPSSALAIYPSSLRTLSPHLPPTALVISFITTNTLIIIQYNAHSTSCSHLSLIRNWTAIDYQERSTHVCTCLFWVWLYSIWCFPL